MIALQFEVILFLLGLAATLWILGIFRVVAALLVFTALIGVLGMVAVMLGVDPELFLLGCVIAAALLLIGFRLWMGDRWDDGPPR